MSRLSRDIARALADKPLRAAVLKNTDHSIRARDGAAAELPSLDDDRAAARRVREHSLDNLEAILKEFIRQFTNSGGRIHHAADAGEACAKVVDILESAKARRGVKSKSMVAEEVCLSAALHRAGIDAVESDLGEFIVQLLGQPPSHITAPAIHLSKREIGEIFKAKLGVPFTEDPAELTSAARWQLRQRFLEAEFAISGANFLVAETGQVLVVENEGNARMGLSLPPILIIIAGIDKVISKLSDAATLLKLLARSATGQRASTYVSLQAPAVASGRSVHLVLLDNGRREALGDPEMREMLLCIRCGACLNVCPVYRTVGGHAYGSVYPGPMGAVLSSLLGARGRPQSPLPFLSTLCGACKDVCPVKIDIPRMLLQLRARATKSLRDKSVAQVWGWTMQSPARLNLLGGIVRTAGAVWKGESASPSYHALSEQEEGAS